jgi:hypothetical protein
MSGARKRHVARHVNDYEVSRLGTVDAHRKGMRPSIFIPLVFATGCACGDDRVLHAYAQPSLYRADIEECITQHACNQLCTQLFQLTDQQQVSSCLIINVDNAGGARVRAMIVDYSVCGANDSGDEGWVYDGSTDDGSCSDGSCDDGSTDDGSTDDGSTDDGSTDDGSTDDGSTDDGSSGGDDGSTDRQLGKPSTEPRPVATYTSH